jgi:serine phosphatase RsbU (regulator of sigma subunit)
VLPNEETINRNIPLSFILFAPRDIVSGDFYWFHEIDKDNYIIVCADCTGHGVPGAMMTVIGSNLLSQIVVDNKITQPSQILLVLDNFINLTLKQQKEHEHFVQDGMDLALLKVDKKNKEFIFSSAKRPAIFIRNKEVREFKGSKHTLGGMITGCKVFSETKMNFREDDIIYFYTDGYTDQFGGPKGKKFSSKQLKEVLLNIHRLKMPEQKETLAATMENWKGSHEQVDDILVMGIKF